jgi:hypothetical protein
VEYIFRRLMLLLLFKLALTVGGIYLTYNAVFTAVQISCNRWWNILNVDCCIYCKLNLAVTVGGIYLTYIAVITSVRI